MVDALLDISDIEGNAIETAGAMLESAESVIDTQFGTGYAEKHPALLAGFIQASALIYSADRLAASARDVAQSGKGSVNHG